MSEDQFEKEILGKAAIDRRSFIKKVIVGSAFAAPVVASFNMFAMSGSASGQTTCTTSNGSSGTGGSGTTGGAGGSRRRSSGEGACGGDPGGATGGSAGSTPSDRALKTAITPVVWA